MEICIRKATTVDANNLSAIEHASDSLFATFDTSMSAIADFRPNPPEFYLPFINAGHIWIVTPLKSLDNPVAFISVRILRASTTTLPPDTHRNVAKSVFIQQISTDPKFMRGGIGKRMVQHVEAWAKENGFEAVELTTFAHVPFNRHWYEKMGYVILTEDQLNEENMLGLKTVLEEERKDPVVGKWDRVAMRKML